MAPPFSRVLIANRGEIAVRIIKTCRKMGIHSIAVYSDADAGAMHVREADSAEYIGPSPASGSYLNIEALLEAAQRSNAEAIHPGYGFLSENADFAEACAEAAFSFVGPSPEAIRAMGDKVNARRIMTQAGVPVIPGYDGADGRPEAIAKAVREIGYPLMVKAAAGGGGRGMRVVQAEEQLDEALQSASREAQAAFGDGRLFIEKLIEGGRHIETQIFGDQAGSIVFLGERECSIQRRHQKVIEECPSPAVDEALRARLAEAAIKAGEAVSYTNAGTVEFLLSPAGSFYFLEMNTRLQVEHPVTEEVFGVDLVDWQLRVASGACLPSVPDPTGHAIEFRVYAEDPARDFLPSPAAIESIEEPEGTRWDTGYEEGDEVPPNYDALLGKLVAWGADRDESLRAARDGLGRLVVRGPLTNIALLRWLAASPALASGEIDVNWLEERLASSTVQIEPPIQALITAAAWDLSQSTPWSGAWRPAGTEGLLAYRLAGGAHELWYRAERYAEWTVRQNDRTWVLSEIDRDGVTLSFRLDGARHSSDVRDRGDYLLVAVEGNSHAVERGRPSRGTARPGQISGALSVSAPMPGVVARLLVREGDMVVSRQPVAILEAMKMEHQLLAPADGIVEEVYVSEGDRVNEGALILSLAPPGSEANSGTDTPS